MGWPFDEIVDAVEDVAEVALDVGADVATGNWPDVAATALNVVSDATGIEELKGVADVVENAGWDDLANVAVNQFADAVGGDAGDMIRAAGGAVVGAASGNWETVVDTAVTMAGDALPPQVAQLAHGIAEDGWDGAVDWAQNNALAVGQQIAGDAFGADAAALMGQVATAYTTGGTDALIRMGAQTLDGVVPGAGGITSQVLSGASPDDVMENLLDQGRSQLVTVGQQAIHATGLGDAFDSDGLGSASGGPGPASSIDTAEELGDWATANLPGGSSAPDLGIGDDLDTPDLVSTASMNTSAGSVSSDAFDDDPGFDDPDWESASTPTAAVVDDPDFDTEADAPVGIQQADAVGDKAMDDVGEMFEDL
jgi:hypothetical protein